jgi:BirA family biotin operon repressor/biotin-[acetyl-CoA-carboxylase] ligase
MTSSNIKNSNRKIGEWTRDWARSVGVGVIYTDSTASTNTDARLFDGKFETLNVIVTDLQTKGRGRGSNTWETPTGGDYLLSSWVRDLAWAPQPIFAARVGLAVYKSLHTKWPELSFSLKAPNDIFLDAQKVAGLLIEVISQANQHRVVVGLGMNVSSSPDLETATNLEKRLGRTITFSEWSEFLGILSKNLNLTIGQESRDVLDYQECEDLRSALNRYPPLKDQVLSVHANASLHMKNKNMNWDEL